MGYYTRYKLDVSGDQAEDVISLLDYLEDEWYEWCDKNV